MYNSFEEFLLKEGNITLEYFLSLWYEEDCNDMQNGILPEDHPDARTLIHTETFLEIRKMIGLDIEDIIDCAFNWNDTQEGPDFWLELDDKWIDFLDKIPWEDEDKFPFAKKSRNIEDFKEVVRDDINLEFNEELV